MLRLRGYRVGRRPLFSEPFFKIVNLGPCFAFFFLRGLFRGDTALEKGGH